MIGTRTPFRVSFAGGGSDLRSFYCRQPGCVLSTSINKYMYIMVHPFFDERIQIKYSRTELVNSIADIQHPIVREALEQFGLEGIDINSIADIPAGTGLGSSCSFTVGLLHALFTYTGKYASKDQLAKNAGRIEIDVLKDPIGKQDIYAAAYGGLNLITFYPDETVQVEPVVMPSGRKTALQENLCLFYLGGARAAGNILAEQQDNIHRDKRIGRTSSSAWRNLRRQLRISLVNGDIGDMGPILDENWQSKRALRPDFRPMDRFLLRYGKAKRAYGRQAVGSVGGGGFLLVYCDKQKQDKLRAQSGRPSRNEVRFR